MRAPVLLLLVPLLGALSWISTSNASPIRARDVLESVERFHPKLAAQESKRAQAKAKILSSQGAFDPTLDFQVERVLEGDYPQTTASATLKQQTRLRGLSVYGKWKGGEGKFATYEDGETSSGGLGTVGAALPLLRGSSIDDSRAELRNARQRVKIEDQGLRQSRLKLSYEALSAYWHWVAAAKRREVAATLQELSEVRVEQVSARVSAGELPAIDQVDNDRALLKRKGAVLKEDRNVQKAALVLSLYLRDGRGRPLVAKMNQVPTEQPKLPEVDPNGLEREFALAVASRPEVLAITSQQQIAKVERARAKNQLLPELNLYGEAGYDFGAREFGVSEKTAIVGLSFQFPVRQRKARGDAEAASSRLRVLEAERLWLENQILVDLRDAHSAFETAQLALGLSYQERELAHQVEEAERERFAIGAVPLLNVTIREKSAAEADIRVIDAELALRTAHNRLLLATARGFSEDAER